jgi:hypothetical protein
MRVMDELNRRGLPRPIPAAELQAMLGPNQAFCSWDASPSRGQRGNGSLAIFIFRASTTNST